MKALLWAGVVAPIIYFATQIAAIALNPSFNFTEQQPSELGVATMHLPILANAGFHCIRDRICTRRLRDCSQDCAVSAATQSLPHLQA